MRRPFALGALCLSLGGCTIAVATVRSYQVEPNGMESREYQLRQAMVAGFFDSTLARLQKRKDAPEDKLLRLLYVGTVAYYAGHYEASIRALDRAQYLAEDRYTKSASRGALAMLTNDRALQYQPGQTERLLVHYFAAQAFLARGNVPAAAVEARRLSYLLEMYDAERDAGDRSMRAALRYFAGVVFEAAGEENDADVAYRNARALGTAADSVARHAAAGPPPPSGTKVKRTRARARPQNPPSAPPVPVPQPREPALIARAATFALPAADAGDVVIVLEHGFVPHRINESLTILLEEDDATAFDGDDETKRAKAAQGVGRRLVAQLARDDDLYYSGNRSRLTLGNGASERASHGSAEHVLTVSWPAFHRAPDVAPLPVVYAGDGIVAPLQVGGDVTSGIFSDFRRARAALATRTVLRAATKYAAARAAEKKAKEEKEEDGKRDWKWEIASGAVEAFGAALERADTRSWHLLPGRISIARVALPPGRHTLSVDAGPGRSRVALGEVEVRTGKIAFVTRRIWDGETLR